MNQQESPRQVTGWLKFWTTLTKERQDLLLQVAESGIPETKWMRRTLSDNLGALEDVGGKRTALGVPKAYRLRSAEELRKELRRRRERLLSDDSRLWSFLVNVFLNVHLQRPFFAVLDTFEVAHNDRGMRIGEGPIAALPSTVTEDRLRNLATVHGVEAIRIIVNALQADYLDLWSFLEDGMRQVEATGVLLDVDSAGGSASDMSPPPTDESFLPVSTDPADPNFLLAQLRNRVADVQGQLENVQEQLRLGLSPTDPGLSFALQQLAADFQHLAVMVGVATMSLTELENAIDCLPRLLAAREFFELFLGLVHARDKDFTAIDSVRDAASSALQDLAAGRIDLTGLEPRKAPFTALKCAIDQWSNLTDSEIQQIDDVITANFGRSIAIAATHGRLVFAKGATETLPGLRDTGKDSADACESNLRTRIAEQPELLKEPSEDSTAATAAKDAPVLTEDEALLSPDAAETSLGNCEGVAASSTVTTADIQTAAGHPAGDLPPLEIHEPLETIRQAEPVAQPNTPPLPVEDSGLKQRTQSETAAPAVLAVATPESAVGTVSPSTPDDLAPPARDDVRSDEPHALQASPPAPHADAVGGSPMCPHLLTFDEFRSTHWVAESGQVLPAPWLTPEFPSALEAALTSAVDAGDLPRIALFARVLAERGIEPEVSPEDLTSIGEIIAHPEAPTSGVAAGRAAVLSKALAYDVPPRGSKLTVFLQAFRPAPDSPADLLKQEDLATKWGFADSSLLAVTSAALRCRASGLDLPTHLRLQIANDSEHRQELESKLLERRVAY